MACFGTNIPPDLGHTSVDAFEFGLTRRVCMFLLSCTAEVPGRLSVIRMIRSNFFILIIEVIKGYLRICNS